MSWINSSTELYCSFAKTAGNTGCQMMNTAFYYYGLNKIYKSFSVDSIESATAAVRALDIKGFAITMPYKIDVLPFLDKLSDDVLEIGACNTVLNDDGVLTGYNTDVFAAQELLSRYDAQKPLFILGNGGYSKAVQYAAKTLGFSYSLIVRNNWDDVVDLKKSLVYNCTPVGIGLSDIHDSNVYINSSVKSRIGIELAGLQASKQFNLYTGLEWPYGK